MEANVDLNNSTTDQSYHYPRPVSIRAWRADVAESLYDAGLDKVASRWESCSDTPKTMVKTRPGAALPEYAEKVYVCSADHNHDAEIYAQSCDLRICPECARRHAARMVHRYLPLFMDLFHRHHNTYMFRHIVFTSPYPLESADIREKYLHGFDQVYSVMSEMMAEKCPGWKLEQGFLVSAEFGEEGRKLHYHVIHYGQYLDQAELSRKWLKQTNGDASVIWVKGFPHKGKTVEKSLREVLKYATKFYSEDKVTGDITAIPPELMPILCRTLDSTRRVRTYGLFYKVQEPDRVTHKCETCGSAMVSIPPGYYVIYVNTGFFPDEWNLAKSGAGLNLKPADKSSSLTSGLAPPNLQEIRKRQMQFAITQKMRWQAKDEF